MAEPRRGFQTPPEVTGYFADKGLRPAFSWQDVWGEEHAYAFTVAKATELELLTAFKSSLATAIAKGQSFPTWRETMLKDLTRIGWAGPRMVTDPTGAWEPKEVDFTNSRRLKTIFWSNVTSARSAGQWERAQRTKAALPYALYVRTASSDPRKEHLGWVGIVLPVDDDWWKTHWPPNGWGCKCSVRMTTGREREKLLTAPATPGGIKYTTTPPDDGPPKTFVNARTGAISEVPAGIDAGWANNPGLNRARTLTTRFNERLREAGQDDAKAAIAALWKTPAPKIFAGLPQAERVQIPAAIAPQLAESLDAKNALITISRDTLANKTAGSRARPTSLDTFGGAQDLIDAGTIVNRGQPNRRTVITERGDGWWSTTVARSAAGFLRIVSVHRIDAWRAFRLLGRDADGGT